MRIDLCTWVKNGAKTLPYVLRRVDKVIPEEAVNKKIFINDHSIDKSPEIARRFGWEVYLNTTPTLGGAINEALRHVESQFFVSVEADLLLAEDWWEKIPPYMEDPKVLVAQGIRYMTNPVLHAMEEKYEPATYVFGPATLDNNIWRTSLVRKLGGFPCVRWYVDRAFYKIVLKSEYKWITDTRVISKHIAPSIREHLRKTYKHILISKTKTPNALKIFLKSPFGGLRLALKTRRPEVCIVYPALRFAILKANLKMR